MASSLCTNISPSPVHDEEQEDRFGALPDPLVLHILSFLPTLYAVRTSILSTRWRTLWTSVGVLDLDEDNDFFSFSTGKRIRGAKPGKRKRKSGFAEFVDNVLLFHQTPTLNKLRLNCCSRKFLRKDSVIRVAVSRRVQTLDLRLPPHSNPDGNAARLHSLLFASQSLVDLRLDLGGSALILPGTLALVRLRRMRLRRVKFLDDQSTRALLSSSTALSSLVLEKCDYQKLGFLEISCSSLRELAIDNSSREEDGLGSCQMKIAAPQLSSFVYCASVAQSYVVEPLSCVEYVKIQFQRFEAQKGLDRRSMLDRTNSLLSSLSSARNLDICPICVEAMRYREIPFRNLNALRTAVKHLDSIAPYVVLRHLLLNPHLRALTVEVWDSSVLPSSPSAGKEDFLKCLGSCFKHGLGAVEKVEIRCSDSTNLPGSANKAVSSTTSECVLELVKVLLGSQARLKKLVLSTLLVCVVDRHNSPNSRRDAVMEKVLSFPRRNRELAVAFI